MVSAEDWRKLSETFGIQYGSGTSVHSDMKSDRERLIAVMDQIRPKIEDDMTRELQSSGHISKEENVRFVENP